MKQLVIAVAFLCALTASAAIPGVNAFQTNNFKWDGLKMSFQTNQALGALLLNRGGLVVTNPVGASNFVWFAQTDVRGMLIDPRNYGVTNWDGVHDDYPGLTNAIAVAAFYGGTLVLPSGTGVISQTITIPSRTYIRGASPVDLTYKGNAPRQSVLRTTGAFTALQTPRLTFPNDNFPFWASDITLENFYVMGPYLQGTAVPGVAGLDLTGVRNIRLVNMHVEGFGTGILVRNTSELKGFGLFVENNYYGLIPSREQYNGNTYDFMGHFYDTMAINNVVDVQLDNPRSVWFYGLERINLSTNATVPFQIVNCGQDSQITISGMIHENQSAVAPRISFDDSGFGILRLLSCNSAVDLNQPIVKGSGYFDLIEITGNQFERGIVTNNHAPIVWITKTGATNNQFVRENRVLVHGNTPHWYEPFVRNDQVGARPENDYIPDGYVNLNPNPNGDHANDGTISVAGSPNYYNGNPMCGVSRIWWDSTTTNNFYELNTTTNLTRGIDHIFVTAVVYDQNGNFPPSVGVTGWGTQDVGWKIISQGRMGAYTNASGDAFAKWVWCITLIDPSYAEAGLTQVQLGSIYSGGGASYTNTGLERFSVYAPIQKNPYGPRKLTHAAIPSTGLEGWHNPGDFYFNDMSDPALTNIFGWVCTVYGEPGVWTPVAAGGENATNSWSVSGTNFVLEVDSGRIKSFTHTP